MRFDKGLNSGLPPVPLRRATQMLLEIAGGTAARGVIDAYPGKSQSEPVLLSAREVERLSGLRVGIGRMRKVLTSLGFECREGNSGAQVAVAVPYWRSDIRCPADLVEEIVRIIGYEKIPATRLSAQLPRQQHRTSPASLRIDLREKLRGVLAGLGFQEILTYPLVSLEKLQKLSPMRELKTPTMRVANPMSREQEYLRISLRGGLLATLARNQKHESAGIRLFEIDKVFLAQGKGLPEEREMLCAVLSGSRAEPCWQSNSEPMDFFDAKGVVENALARCGIEAAFGVSEDEALFSGRGADVFVGDDRIGVLGELHPEVAQAFDLSDRVYLIELDLEKLLSLSAGTGRYRPVSRFPGVTRDIALVVDEQVSYHSVESIVRGFPLVTEVILFDLYRGEQLPAGKKSFAIRIMYQSPSRTLTDEEVDRTQEQMLGRLQREVSAVLRS